MNKISAKDFKYDDELIALIRRDVEIILDALSAGSVLYAENQCKILKEFLEV